MGAYKDQINWETLRSIDSATLTGVYLPLGSPLLHPSYIFKMINNSSVLVTVSIDGVNDIDVLPAGSFFLYDEGKGLRVDQLSLQKGTQVFVKGAAGVGLIYLATQYIVTV